MSKIYLVLLSFILFSCTSQSKYEEVIKNYLETDKKGVKTDLQIEFISMDISDITVSDSIAILQNQFKAEKANKIETIQGSINRLSEKTNTKIGEKANAVNNALVTRWQKDIHKLEEELLIVKDSKAIFLNKYDSRNPLDLLAKKADCTFSFFNPKLQTRQEIKALFILSNDGTQCNNMIK